MSWLETRKGQYINLIHYDRVEVVQHKEDLFWIVFFRIDGKCTNYKSFKTSKDADEYLENIMNRLMK